MLEKDTLAYWTAAKRIRLTPVGADFADVDECLDDLIHVHVNTQSDRLALLCSEALEREAARCALSA
jgi:hypothetical protein